MFDSHLFTPLMLLWKVLQKARITISLHQNFLIEVKAVSNGSVKYL